jgi:hypothetical protein
MISLHATCRWKDLNKGYNFALDLTSIGGLHTKLRKSQFREFLDSNLGVSRQNDIWVLALWLGTENTIRGKVVASPKSQAVVNFMSSCLLIVHSCTKSVPTMH